MQKCEWNTQLKGEIKMLFYVKCEVKQHYMVLPEEMYEMQLKTLEYIFDNKKMVEF
jgi:hypothetical protein